MVLITNNKRVFTLLCWDSILSEQFWSQPPFSFACDFGRDWHDTMRCSTCNTQTSISALMFSRVFFQILAELSWGEFYPGSLQGSPFVCHKMWCSLSEISF